MKIDPMEMAFLKVIHETPLDTVVRKAYSDWLDEHDRPEEADFFGLVVSLQPAIAGVYHVL